MVHTPPLEMSSNGTRGPDLRQVTRLAGRICLAAMASLLYPAAAGVPASTQGTERDISETVDIIALTHLYRLERDSSDGGSHAIESYRLVDLRTGMPMWSISDGVSFHGAAISDQGETVGVGYSAGLPGRPRGSVHERCGLLTITIIGLDGTLLQQHAIRRLPRRVSHSYPFPTVSKVLIAPGAQVAFVCMDENLLDTTGESVWTYDLVSGEFLAAFHPSRMSPGDPLPASNTELAAVGGTPLIAATWWARSPVDASEGRTGDQFVAVYDSLGRTIWQQVTPRSRAVARLASDHSNPTLRLVGSHAAFSVSVGPLPVRQFRCESIGLTGGWRIIEVTSDAGAPGK